MYSMLSMFVIKWPCCSYIKSHILRLDEEDEFEIKKLTLNKHESLISYLDKWTLSY